MTELEAARLTTADDGYDSPLQAAIRQAELEDEADELRPMRAILIGFFGSLPIWLLLLGLLWLAGALP